MTKSKKWKRIENTGYWEEYWNENKVSNEKQRSYLHLKYMKKKIRIEQDNSPERSGNVEGKSIYIVSW